MAKIKQATKKTGRARKELIVEELSAKIEASDGLVLTDYKGLTHQQIEKFKKELKTEGSNFAVTKNTLLKISVEKSEKFGKLLPEESLDNPTATLFIKGDGVDALKKLAKLIKEAGLPKIKVGIINGEVMDEASVIKLSELPPRDVLLAMLSGMLQSPVQGLVVVLSANLQKLAIALNEIAKNKPAEAATAEPVPPTPATPAEQTEQPAEVSAPVEPTQEPVAEAATPVEEAKPAEEAAPAEVPTESQDQNSEGGES